MANALKGEVDFQIGEKTYVMVIDVNSQVEVETLMSTPMQKVAWLEVYERAVKLHRMTEFRAIFWGCLRRYHREITLEQAGDLMEEAGGAEGFAKKFADLVFAVTPAKSDLETLGIKTDRPLKARATKRKAGTGTRSMPTPDTVA